MKSNALILIPILAALMAAGCGKHGDDQATGGVPAGQAVATEPAGQAVPASMPPGGTASQPSAEPSATTADSLPPDISVSAPDSLIVAGTVVEIVARGTPDVVEVTLWDGVGSKQPMTYDAPARVWRGFYRVPLGFSRDRMSLSVTARNAAARWRRNWIVLGVQPGTPAAAPGSGS